MIYLDNSATSFLYKEVLDKMNYIYKTCNFNPSAAYDAALDVEKELVNARKIIADSINAKESEIIFTSGGSESNNTAIQGISRANKNRGKHIITSMVEHSSIYNTFVYLQKEGFDVTFIKPDKSGTVSVEDVKENIRKDTILVSLIHVNNEIGSVNDIYNIGGIIKSVNPLTYFHVDAVQSYMKLKIDVSDNNIDLLSVSGHKVHAPKGIGFLYVKKNTKISPLIFGGSQENNLRAGTENVAGICALAKAVELQRDFKNVDEIRANKDYLKEQISKKIDDIRINTPVISSPHILSVSFAGIKSEILLHYLEIDNIYISIGSACSSKKKNSRVLDSIFIEDRFKDGTIRISLSEFTGKDELDILVEKLMKYVYEIRKVTKYKKDNKRLL